MDEKELMKKEWDFAWEHIKNVRHIYWTLFLSIIALNGIIIKYYFEIPDWQISLKDGIASILLLIINSFIILIYQREHFAQEENYIPIYRIRKTILSEKNDSNKWNYFFHKEKSLMKGQGYIYYVILKAVIGLSVPIYIFLKYFNYTIDSVCKMIIIIIFCLLFVISLCRFIYIQNTISKKINEIKNE